MSPGRTPGWLAGLPEFELGHGGMKINRLHLIIQDHIQKMGRLWA
jgi:hypothetical protein